MLGGQNEKQISFNGRSCISCKRWNDSFYWRIPRSRNTRKIIDALVAKGVKDLTVIGNDTGFPDRGIGRLVVNNQVKKVIASHIGTNPETGRRMQTGEMEVELAPQGTLAERVRAGGNGLGGILTPTGIGTIVEEGKEIITVDGKNIF